MNPAKLGNLTPEMASALGGLAYGLYFLSTGSLEQPRGMLVSWVSQVSGDPPLIQVAVRHNRGMLPEIMAQGEFALNLLPSGDRDLAAALGRPPQQRWDGIKFSEGPLGLPVLTQGPGAIGCRILDSSRPGDHELILVRPSGALWRGGPVLSTAEFEHAYLGLS
ncbi:MAG: flavin reductase family protein [Deltaproteobacteria bacterium]|nr:flavin reductase family protein [Deltaproteobacteria bacterium]